MEIKTMISCPLGSQCEEIKPDGIHRCAWFIELVGENPSTGEPINDRGCAMRWIPILLVENSRQQRGTSAAVESFRNEMAEANDKQQRILMARQTVMVPVHAIQPAETHHGYTLGNTKKDF